MNNKKIQHKEVIPFLKRENLHKYQNDAINFIKNNKGSGLFLDMGL